MTYRNIFLSLVLMLMTAMSAFCAGRGDGGHVPEVGRSVRPGMKVLAREQRAGYECRLVEFSVERSERVKGYLLVPDGASRSSRLPAVLMLHDHGARFDIGKEKLARPICNALPFGENDHLARSSVQWVEKNFDGVWLADSLAASGYVVLVSDALYWGERSSDEAQRWSELTFGDPEHCSLESDRNLDGKSRSSEIKALKKTVYEGQRSVYAELQSEGVVWAEKILRDDVASVRLLADLPFVDGDRVGAFGFSMGAHRCWLLSAFCDEVRCGVALSWMTSLDGYDGSNASDLSMRIQPMREHMDFGDIGQYLAPKPMLFLSGDTDHLFPQDMVKKAYDLLNFHYNKAGSCALRTEFFPDGHHCGKDVQKTIAGFFDKELKNCTKTR